MNLRLRASCLIALVTCGFAPLGASVDEPRTESWDIVVYGANAPGVVAGIQAARLGKRVIIVEPSTHLGGLTTGGLGATDTGRKQIRLQMVEAGVEVYQGVLP